MAEFEYGKILRLHRLKCKDNPILPTASSLVDNPDEVELNEIPGIATTVFELQVTKEDVGKVIGKHGKTAQAIRILVNATANKLKKRVVLEIIEE